MSQLVNGVDRVALEYGVPPQLFTPHTSSAVAAPQTFRLHTGPELEALWHSSLS
jgi:hypothetical protein